MKLWKRKYIITVVALDAIILLAAAVSYRITQRYKLTRKAANTVELWLEQQMKILTATADSISLSAIGQNDETLKPLIIAMSKSYSTFRLGSKEVKL